MHFRFPLVVISVGTIWSLFSCSAQQIFKYLWDDWSISLISRTELRPLWAEVAFLGKGVSPTLGCPPPSRLLPLTPVADARVLGSSQESVGEDEEQSRRELGPWWGVGSDVANVSQLAEPHPQSLDPTAWGRWQVEMSLPILSSPNSSSQALCHHLQNKGDPRFVLCP